MCAKGKKGLTSNAGPSHEAFSLIANPLRPALPWFCLNAEHNLWACHGGRSMRWLTALIAVTLAGCLGAFH